MKVWGECPPIIDYASSFLSIQLLVLKKDNGVAWRSLWGSGLFLSDSVIASVIDVLDLFFLCRPPQKTRGQTPSMIGKDGKGVPEEWQSILVTFTFKLLFFFLASSAELKCRLFVQQETSLTPSAAAAAVKEGKPRRRRLWNEKLRWHWVSKLVETKPDWFKLQMKVLRASR